MPNLGATEILIILAIILLFFGAAKLPDLARSMGRSARIFKSEINEMRKEDQDAQAQTQQQLPPATSPETQSTVQGVNPQTDSFWDRPENQPRR